MVYLEDDEIRGGQDPGMFEDEGKNVILVVKENTIRVEDFYYEAPGRDAPANYEYQPERLDEKIKALEIVPINHGGYRSLFMEDQNKGALAKRILQEKYGWPDNFHETGWRAAGSSICWKMGDGNVDYEAMTRYAELESDMEEQDEDAISYYGTPVYAEEIDGPCDSYSDSDSAWFYLATQYQ
ncbi:hypothetical protein BDV12DRAFT_205027 [Aspergillus spectabilis]